jgi:hypothetical protein
MRRMTDLAETSTAPDERPARHAFVRIPSAILAAFVLASVVIAIWTYLIGPHVPDSVDNLVGSLLLFALAPILAGVFLRGSRLMVRVAVGLFAAWIWVFWLFLVLVPITS